jgi:hypothetical protein
MTYNVIPSSGSGQVRSLVEALKDVAGALAEADPKLKAQVYEELGVTVTYDPDRRVAKLESRPQIAWAKVSVGGGLEHLRRTCWNVSRDASPSDMSRDFRLLAVSTYRPVMDSIEKSGRRSADVVSRANCPTDRSYCSLGRVPQSGTMGTHPIQPDGVRHRKAS